MSDLDSLKRDLDFDIDSIDCRATSCRVGLDWKNRPTSPRDLEALATASYANNCVRQVFPAAETHDGKVMLLFNCEGQVAAQR
jgi:hypothetical protein